MNTIGALPIIVGNYIKYDRLQQITNEAFKGSDATECNIFIDLYSILLPLYSGNYSPSMDKSDTDIAAGIINMIAHYRRFFWTRYRVTTKFFLVYSRNCSHTSTIFYPKYNESFMNSVAFKKDVTETITFNLSLIDKIAPYIPDTAFVTTNFETCVMMNDIIVSKLNDFKTPCIVITKDIVCMQLAASLNNVIIYRPKLNRGTGEDISYYVSNQNNGLYEHLIKSRDNKRFDFYKEIDSSLYGLILALTRVPERNITSILPLSHTLKSISDITNGFIVIPDIQFVIDRMADSDRDKAIRNGVYERYKSLDLIYQYGMFLNSSDRHNYKGLMNLYDPEGIHQIVNEYFKSTPLNLENL